MNMYGYELKAKLEAGLTLLGYDREEQEYEWCGNEMQWRHANFLEDKYSVGEEGGFEDPFIEHYSRSI